jgi:hypothetical protein
VTTWGDWISDLALAAGPRTIAWTIPNREALAAWMAGEGTQARWNPLATTEPWPGATLFNSAGVKNYPTRADGIEATLQTLRNGDYPHLLAALHFGASAPATVVSVAVSPWGTWAGRPASALSTLGVVQRWPSWYYERTVSGS